MARLAWLTAMLMCVSACGIGASSGSLAARSPSPSPEAAKPGPIPSPVVTPVQPSPSPSPAPSPAASTACRNSSGATNFVMIGASGQWGMTHIYDVTDPVHPRLQCRIQNTSAHLSNGISFTYLKPRSADLTDIVIRSFADGNERATGALPLWVADGAWLPTGALGAYTVPAGPTDSTPAGSVQVWLYEQGNSVPLYTYRSGIGGCMCRLAFALPLLAFSPDGKYLAVGNAFGKGAEPLTVYRVSDRTRVATFDQDVMSAFWDRSATRLFVNRYGNLPAQVWTPQGGVASLNGAKAWTHFAGQSPDGLTIAYTAYVDPDLGKDPRVFVYDVKTATTRMLVDKLRTQVIFVRNGWVWYLEERLCTDSCPGGTIATGKVFAMQLSTGTETEVSFAAGESPMWPQAAFGPGEFWPREG